uniref:Uncharacterized protein n=1 Tax=Siphoviridae sp. ctbvd11 TaxID=2825567 RepID=A0A8S5QEA9_9CAUD|nr:MAG TPA: hypothetical protein [Siphoviridae sp. ctbvd11]
MREWQLAGEMQNFLHIFYIFQEYFCIPAYISL